MFLKRVICVAVLTMMVSAVWASDALKLAEAGQAALARGEFETAMKQFAQAARAEPTHMGYRQAYSILRQVIKMRKSIETEKNPVKWEYTAQALRAFYRDNNLYKEALPLDRKFYETKKDADSALLLAETQLELGMNQALLDFAGSLPPACQSASIDLMRVIALGRLNQKAQALELLKGVTLGEKASFMQQYYLARARNVLGQAEEALATLTGAFESTPPAFLPALKSRAAACRDFQSFYAPAEAGQKPAPKPAFAKALATESKIAESGCTGGSSCGSCRYSSSCKSAAGGGASCEKQ